MQSTQGTTQQEASRTPEFQDLNLDSLQYDDDDQSKVSYSFTYDWQFSGHRFIGERVSRLYPNEKTWIFMNVLLLWNNIVKIFHPLI